MSTKQKISPCLWFDGRAEEAAKFYTSIFPDLQIDHIASIDTPGAKEGAVILVEFRIAGLSQPFIEEFQEGAHSDTRQHRLG